MENRFHSGKIRLIFKKKNLSNLLDKIIKFRLLLDRQDSSLRSWVSLIHFPQISIRIPVISHLSHIFSLSNFPAPHYLYLSYPVEISNLLAVCYSTMPSYSVLYYFFFQCHHMFS